MLSHLSRQRKVSHMLCSGAYKSVLLVNWIWWISTWKEHGPTAETQSSHCYSSPGSAWETLALEWPPSKVCGPWAWAQALLTWSAQPRLQFTLYLCSQVCNSPPCSDWLCWTWICVCGYMDLKYCIWYQVVWGLFFFSLDYQLKVTVHT